MTQSAPKPPIVENSRFPSGPLPPRAGAGLKTDHVDAILADDYRIGFLEVHAENYMGDGGPAHRALAAIRNEFPLSVHGVGLSIGSEEGIDPAHLERLAGVVERYQPAMVSEHLAWSSHDAGYFNDLLPVPYDRQTLDRVVTHIRSDPGPAQTPDPARKPVNLRGLRAVDDERDRFHPRDRPEIRVRTVAGHQQCLCFGHQPRLEADALPSRLPAGTVEEIHLAGHAEDVDDEGDLILIDAHDRPVADAVWKLYETVICQAGALPTLIEWDNDVPEWPVLRREALLADAILDRLGPASLLGSRHAAE
jgi:uncharacterized protein (UPF0276 family)